MMIDWPDQWYHTSGDHVDKTDPTQLKRVAIIGAAAASIANADEMASGSRVRRQQRRARWRSLRALRR
jgi:hypothetical protein